MGRLGKYISLYIYIVYVYLYICIYVYAIDICKEMKRKGSWYVHEALFFSLSQQQLSHLALVSFFFFFFYTKKTYLSMLSEESLEVLLNLSRTRYTVEGQRNGGTVTGQYADMSQALLARSQ